MRRQCLQKLAYAGKEVHAPYTHNNYQCTCIIPYEKVICCEVRAAQLLHREDTRRVWCM